MKIIYILLNCISKSQRRVAKTRPTYSGIYQLLYLIRYKSTLLIVIVREAIEGNIASGT